MQNAPENKTAEIPQKMNFRKKYWPLVAICSGICFSLHNELFFNQSKETTKLGMGLAVLLPYWVGQLPILLVYIGIQCQLTYSKLSTPWSKQASKYYMMSESQETLISTKPSTYVLHWFNVWGLLIRCFLIHSGMFAFYYVMIYVDAAQVSLAVIASLFSSAAFFTALVFHIAFNEKLQIRHYLGMVLMTLAIFIVTQSKPQAIYDHAATVGIWVPILLVMLNSVIITCITTHGRYWFIKSNMDSFLLQMDAYILHVITTALFHLFVYSDVTWQMPWSLWAWTSAGAFFNMLGWLLCCEAAVNGIAGPAQALI